MRLDSVPQRFRRVMKSWGPSHSKALVSVREAGWKNWVAGWKKWVAGWDSGWKTDFYLKETLGSCTRSWFQISIETRYGHFWRSTVKTISSRSKFVFPTFGSPKWPTIGRIPHFQNRKSIFSPQCAIAKSRQDFHPNVLSKTETATPLFVLARLVFLSQTQNGKTIWLIGLLWFFTTWFRGKKQ